MKNKTRGTISLVCGIICVLCEVLFIILNLAFKYDFDGRNNIVSNIALLILGIYLCPIPVFANEPYNTIRNSSACGFLFITNSQALLGAIVCELEGPRPMRYISLMLYIPFVFSIFYSFN